MRIYFLLGVALGVVVRGSAYSAEPMILAEFQPTPASTVSQEEEAELAGRVRRLIRQLDAPQAAERAKAEQALLDLGPEILDLLPQIDPQHSPQVAVSLARIREQFERRLAESVIKPACVSLPAKPIPYREVLQEIQKQTGNRLQIRADVEELIKGRVFQGGFEKKPFWQVLDQLLDEAGLTVYLYPADAKGEPMILPRPEHERPRSPGANYVGPFRMTAQRVIAQRELRSTLGDHLVLVLEVAWEPRIFPVVLRLPHQSVQAQDNEGHLLEPSQPEAQSTVPIKTGQRGTELEVRFRLPARSAERLEWVRGKWVAILPGAVQRFPFTQLGTARNVSQRRAGATVTLREVRKEGPLWQLAVLLRYDRPSEAFQSHYHWFYRNRAVLQSADGQTAASTGVEPFRHTDSEIGLLYTFEGIESLEKYTFIYEAPGLLLTEEFPFELRDVPLP